MERAARMMAIQMVLYKQDYNKEPRRVASLELEDGRYIDLVVDENCRKNYCLTGDGGMEENTLFCVIPPNPAEQMILRASLDVMRKIEG